jgi:hypothetical protein
MAQRERASTEVLAAYEKVCKLGLQPYLAELEALGLTVIPPELASPDGLADRLRDAVVAVSTQRNAGIAPDFATGATHAEIASPDGQLLTRLLTEDPVFEEAVLNPVVMAFGRYILGDALRLFSCRSIIKGPGALPLFLHADQPVNQSAPLIFNATYLLTHYTRDGGALCYVPGSHRRNRQPTPAEDFTFGSGTFLDALSKVKDGHTVACEPPADAVAVEAPRGSVVIWYGNTWHGAFARTEPGLRANLITVFAHAMLEPQEAYRDVPAEMIERRGQRLARLLRHFDPHG